MKDINDLLNEISISQLRELAFTYNDTLTFDESDFENDNENLNYFKWKLYSGDITSDEKKLLENKDDNTAIIKLIYVVIFNFMRKENWHSSITLQNYEDYDNLCKEVMDLWLMRPEGFIFEVEFKKLIFMLYLVKNQEIFRQIALEFYKENNEARNYIEQHDEYKPLFLLHRIGDVEYKNSYAIEEITSEEAIPVKVDKSNPTNIVDNKDWITKRFG